VTQWDKLHNCFERSDLAQLEDYFIQFGGPIFFSAPLFRAVAVLINSNVPHVEVDRVLARGQHAAFGEAPEFLLAFFKTFLQLSVY